MERSGLSRRIWKDSGGPDNQEGKHFSHLHLKDSRTSKVMHLTSCLDNIPGTLLSVFMKS